MKIANAKSMVAKGMMVALAAGAFMIASPAKAQAQGFAVGVQVGNPHFYDARRDDYARRDRFEFERRQEILRHQEWLRHEELRRHEEFREHEGFRDRDFRGHDWR